MARMATKEPVSHDHATAAGGWGGDVAHAVKAHDEGERQRREDAHVSAARLQARVKADGLAFFQRVAAECRAAADAFNVQIGQTVLDVSQAATGPLIVVTARSIEGAGFVAVLPLLSTEDRAPAPGAIVTTRLHGRESRMPYDFALGGGADVLCMRCGGEWLSPEAFARAMLTPWLSSIALGGR